MPEMPGTFRASVRPTRSELRAATDRRRGSARQRGYTTGWDKAARGFLNSHPLCIGCIAVDRVTAAELVDHIVPHKGDQVLMWDRSNWQASCAWHHNVVKQLLERQYADGTITAADLKLDSPAARHLTRERGGGV